MREDYKEQGVEFILIEAATNLAFTNGAAKVEGDPKPHSVAEKPFTTWNTFHGFQNIYDNLGYRQIENGKKSPFYRPMEKRRP